jgi:predicted PurR-regulated permease PerM
MPAHRFQTPFFLVLLLAVAVATLAVLSPFFTPLVVAVGLAVLLRPLHRRLTVLLKGKEGVAAFLCVLFAMVVVFGPVAAIAAQAIREAADLYRSLAQDDWSTVRGLVDGVQEMVRTVAPSFRFEVRELIQPVLAWIASHAGAVFSGTFQTAFAAVVAFLAAFYLLRDGALLKRRIIELSPLSDGYDEAIFERLSGAMRSVLRGSLSIAVIQGVLTGIGFAVSGVPNATLWGAFAAVCALIPGVGTAIVLIPGIFYLYATGSTVAGTVLLAWSVGAVGLIDNALAPYLVGRGARVHPFLVFLAVIGGLGLFGAIGFFLGPLVLSLLFALIDIYEMMFGDKRGVTLPRKLAKAE